MAKIIAFDEDARRALAHAREAVEILEGAV